MPKYRKKPVVIDAVLYAPGMEDGYACYAIAVGTSGKAVTGNFIGYFDKNGPIPKCIQKPAIKTLEGFHEISPGDWIITGVAGERYPCKPDIFAATYEAVATYAR